MSTRIRQFPFGEVVAMIPVDREEYLQVCAAQRAPDRFTVLRCPGAILELCASPAQMLARTTALVVEAAQRIDVSAGAYTHVDGTIRLHLHERELVLDPAQATQALRLIHDAARALFTPAFDRPPATARETTPPT